MLSNHIKAELEYWDITEPITYILFDSHLKSHLLHILLPKHFIFLWSSVSKLHCIICDKCLLSRNLESKPWLQVFEGQNFNVMNYILSKMSGLLSHIWFLAFWLYYSLHWVFKLCLQWKNLPTKKKKKKQLVAFQVQLFAFVWFT